MSNVVHLNYFAAVPGRAVRDQNISGLQFRTLAAIAGHDRMGRNGQGCWAGRKAMAARIGCTETSFSEAISWLVKEGYIEVMVSETDGRRRGYRVVYDTAEDAKGIGARHKESGSANADVSQLDKSANADVSTGDRSAKADQPTVDKRQKAKVEQLVKASIRKPNIFPEGDKNISLKRKNTPIPKDEAGKGDSHPPNPKTEIIRYWYEPVDQHEAWELLKRLRPFEWNRLIGLWKKGALTDQDKQWAEENALKELAGKELERREGSTSRRAAHG